VHSSFQYDTYASWVRRRMETDPTMYIHILFVHLFIQYESINNQWWTQKFWEGFQAQKLKFPSKIPNTVERVVCNKLLNHKLPMINRFHAIACFSSIKKLKWWASVMPVSTSNWVWCYACPQTVVTCMVLYILQRATMLPEQYTYILPPVQ